MTFFEISLKMFYKNIIRYRLYFLGCLMAATVFFCFASIFTNPTFMDGQTVNSMISNNIIFPSILAAFMLLVFVPYSYAAFLSAREQEYGILLSLGMSRRMSVQCLLLEGIVLGVLALGVSFVAGTCFSMIFYEIISQVIGITKLQWQIPCEAYIATALLYGAALIFAAVYFSVQLMGKRIRLLLLAPYRAEQKGWGYRWMKKYFPGYMGRHLLEVSLLVRHKKAWIARYCVSALLVGFVIYLVSFSAVFQSALFRDVENYCPYDLAYSEIYDKNKVSESNLKAVLNDYHVSVVEATKISYARDAAFNYLCVSEVNEKLGCSYRIPDGMFLNLFQYDLEDGYGHEIVEIPQVSLRMEDKGDKEYQAPGADAVRRAKSQMQEMEKEVNLQSCGSDIRILFNKNAALADHTLILNDDAFHMLKSNCNYSYGTMHLFKLQNWRESLPGILAFQDLLQEENELTSEEQQYFRADAKAERFQKARQSGQFGVFLFCFLEALLLMAAFLLIQFQITAEQEENRRMQKSLFMIGMSGSEQYRLFRFKNRMHFLLPLAISLVFFLPVNYKLGENVYHSGKLGCLAGLAASLILFFVIIIYNSCYSHWELAVLRRSKMER